MPPEKIKGIATHYRGNGRKLGYPTANIPINTVLPDGVYFGYADLGRFVRRPSIIFIGTPTTVGDTVRRLEAHLLDIPDQNYYGLRLSVEVWHLHRSTRTFDSVEDLLRVMKTDEAAARRWFAQH